VFSYIGRFSPEKGLDTLAKAYTKYRAMSSDPWELMCCGAGPMQSLLDGQPGIRVEGFIQPRDLPEKLASSGCLVLPSHSEAWGLVVHEATSAGLPVIVSDRVGASVHLVQPGYNGFIFKTGDVDDLASQMLRISGMTAGRLDAMSKASYSLSQQYSPVLWVDTLFESYECLFARTKRG